MAKNCIICNRKLGLFEKLYEDKYCKECYEKQEEQKRKRIELEKILKAEQEKKIKMEKINEFKNYFLFTNYYWVILKGIDFMPFHYNDIFTNEIKNKFDVIKMLLDEIVMQLPNDYNLTNIKEMTTYRNSSKIMEKVLKKYINRSFNSDIYCILTLDKEKYASDPNNNILDDLEENGNGFLYVSGFAKFDITIQHIVENKIKFIQLIQKDINDWTDKANHPNKYDSSKCIELSHEYQLEQTYEMLSIYYFYAMQLIFYSYLNKTIENEIKKSELYSIYAKLKAEVHNDNYIIEKLFPIYNSLYKDDFDIVFEDENDFKLLIEIINDRENVIEKEDYINIDSNILSIDINKYINIQNDDELAYNVFDAINTNVISYKNYLSIDDIFDIAIYSRRYLDVFHEVKKQQSLIERERILNGNFAKEKKILNASLDYSTINNGYEFESFVANLYKMLDYNVVDITSKSGDQGADVIIEKDNIKYAIQVKYYNNPVGNKAIQEVVAAKSFYKTDKSMVVTNSTFTPQAITLANANDVLLVDGNKLNELINQVKNK